MQDSTVPRRLRWYNNCINTVQRIQIKQKIPNLNHWTLQNNWFFKNTIRNANYYFFKKWKTISRKHLYYQRYRIPESVRFSFNDDRVIVNILITFLSELQSNSYHSFSHSNYAAVGFDANAKMHSVQCAGHMTNQLLHHYSLLKGCNQLFSAWSLKTQPTLV